MRVVFTCYALTASAVCFVLTLALSLLPPEGSSIEKLAKALFSLTYLAFGPMLMIFSGFGLSQIPGLMYQCELTHITDTLNPMDVCIVIGCAVFSSLVTFFYSLHAAIEAAQASLHDEKSIFYRLYFSYLLKRRPRGYGSVE